VLWGNSVSPKEFFRLESFQNSEISPFFSAFSPRDVDRRKWRKYSSTVARLWHWASTFVYNSMPWRSVVWFVRGRGGLLLGLCPCVTKIMSCFEKTSIVLAAFNLDSPIVIALLIFESSLKMQNQEMKGSIPRPKNADPMSSVPESTNCYWNRRSFVITKIPQSWHRLPIDGKESMLWFAIAGIPADENSYRVNSRSHTSRSCVFQRHPFGHRFHNYAPTATKVCTKMLANSS